MKTLSREINSFLGVDRNSKNNNICVFATDENNNFNMRALKKFLKIEIEENLRKEEAYTNKFFAKDLSLANNFDYVSNLYFLEKEKFLSFHGFADSFQENKNQKIKNLHSEIVEKFSLFLYLKISETSMIYKNINSCIKSLSDFEYQIFQGYFDSNQVMYFSASRNYLKISKMFNHFLISDGKSNDFAYFNDFKKVREFRKENQ